MNNVKKFNLFSLFCFGMLCLLITGCTKEESLGLTFDQDDIESVEISKYLDTELSSSVDIVEKEKIAHLYGTFEGLKIKKGKLEKREDKETLVFKFHLKDGKDYEIIYYPIAVKKGSIVFSDNKDIYTTSSDIAGMANNVLK